MALKVIYRDEATDDIVEAMKWYRDQKEGLEEHFLAAVLACEAFVLQFPKGAPILRVACGYARQRRLSAACGYLPTPTRTPCHPVTA